jgi:hypothetical protein
MNNKSNLRNIIAGLFAIMVLLSACNQPRDFGITPTTDGTESIATEIFIQATQEQVEKTLTATSLPLAMKVNGIQYPLDEFKNDWLRFLMVFTELAPEEAFNTLTTDLTEQLILQNAAMENGFNLSEGDLDQRIDTLINQVGGEQQFNQWLSNNYYTDTSFRRALYREVAVAYQKEIILDQIPDELEQVELSQILVYDEGTAKQILQAIAEGTDFFWLAEQYHPATIGYIGWNPRGAMLPNNVENTAFSMEVGTSSEVIQTDYGYHILYLNQREMHQLSPENLQILQEKALLNWMEIEKESAVIEIYTSYDQ